MMYSHPKKHLRLLMVYYIPKRVSHFFKSRLKKNQSQAADYMIVKISSYMFLDCRLQRLSNTSSVPDQLPQCCFRCVDIISKSDKYLAFLFSVLDWVGERKVGKMAFVEVGSGLSQGVYLLPPACWQNRDGLPLRFGLWLSRALNRPQRAQYGRLHRHQTRLREPRLWPERL